MAGATHVLQRFSPHRLACVPLIAFFDLPWSGSGRSNGTKLSPDLKSHPSACVCLRAKHGIPEDTSILILWRETAPYLHLFGIFIKSSQQHRRVLVFLEPVIE